MEHMPPARCHVCRSCQDFTPQLALRAHMITATAAVTALPAGLLLLPDCFLITNACLWFTHNAYPYYLAFLVLRDTPTYLAALLHNMPLNLTRFSFWFAPLPVLNTFIPFNIGCWFLPGLGRACPAGFCHYLLPRTHTRTRSRFVSGTRKTLTTFVIAARRYLLSHACAPRAYSAPVPRTGTFITRHRRARRIPAHTFSAAPVLTAACRAAPRFGYCTANDASTRTRWRYHCTGCLLLRATPFCCVATRNVYRIFGIISI